MTVNDAIEWQLREIVFKRGVIKKGLPINGLEESMDGVRSGWRRGRYSVDALTDPLEA